MDSALYYEQQAYKEMLQAGEDVNLIIFRNLENIQAKPGNDRLAMDYIKRAFNHTVLAVEDEPKQLCSI